MKDAIYEKAKFYPRAGPTMEVLDNGFNISFTVLAVLFCKK
jgi:hypothetical protein